MQMTPDARAWLDATVRRILARHPLGDAERSGITYELMSHLHGAGEAHATAAGRSEVGRADLEAALAESGGEEGLAAAFVKPLSKPIERVLLWRRLAAFAIDFVLVGIAVAFVHHFLTLLLRPLVGTIAPAHDLYEIYWLVPFGYHDPSLGLLGQLIIAIASVGVLLGYFTWLEGHGGRSLGKLALQLRVMREDGRPMTYRAAFIRNLAKVAPVVLVVDAILMLVFFHKERQRVSDKAAGTIVVRV